MALEKDRLPKLKLDTVVVRSEDGLGRQGMWRICLKYWRSKIAGSQLLVTTSALGGMWWAIRLSIGISCVALHYGWCVTEGTVVRSSVGKFE